VYVAVYSLFLSTFPFDISSDVTIISCPCSFVVFHPANSYVYVLSAALLGFCGTATFSPYW